MTASFGMSSPSHQSIAPLLFGVWLFGSAVCMADDGSAPPPKELLSLASHPNYHTVAYSPDGKRLAAPVPQDQFAVWDAETGKQIMIGAHQGLVLDVTFSPDGKWLASAGRDGARLWDTATGKEVLRIKGRGCMHRLAFHPDGKRLAIGGITGVSYWEIPGGQELDGPRGSGTPISSLVYSPDGKHLATSGHTDRVVHVWEVATGDERLALSGHTAGIDTLGFSPDGKRLASASLDRTVRLWDLASGAEVLTLKGHKGAVHNVAFSPDGRRIATGSADRTVKLCDLSNGEEIFNAGHTGAVYGIAFRPDGRRLASTGSDATVRIWSIDAPTTPPSNLTPAQLEDLWTDLQGDHAGKSFRAMLTLSASPQQTLPFLKVRLKPAQSEPEREKRLTQLLADLDDARFLVRQRATAELEEWGKRAEPTLREVLEKRPSLEVRQRVERLLDRLRGATRTPDEVLAKHGVEVLERMDTPEARAFLTALAEGAPGSWLTSEAAAALKQAKSR